MNIFKRIHTTYIKNNAPLCFSFAVMLFFLSPFFWQASAIVLPWIDNMDSYLVWNKIAAEHVNLFESTTKRIPVFMNGVPMYGVAGGLSTFFILNKILPAFPATAFYYLLIHTVAVLGMYWLTNSYIAPQKKWIAAAASLAFSLQGFLPAWGLGVAGVPMMIAVYLRNRTQGFEWYTYALIVLYALSSNVQSAGIFIILAGSIAAIVESVRAKKALWKLYLPTLFLVCIFILIRGELFYQLLSGEGYVSHRTEFYHAVPNTNEHIWLVMWQALKNPLGILLSSGVFPFLMIVSVYPFVVWRSIDIHSKKMILLLYTILFSLAFYAGITQSIQFVKWRNSIPFLRMYSMERVLIMIDIVWYLLFAYSLTYIARIKFGPSIIIIILLGQTALHVYHASWWKGIFGWKEKYQPMAYEDYYSEKLFEQIKHDIGLEPASYKVAAFGIHPAVLQYNGFYTADGYCSNYPLEYKNKFRKIIEAELPEIVKQQKSANNAFDTWGHKLYLQSSKMFEIAHTGPPITIHQSVPVPTPKWNMDAMRAIGIKYVIAAMEITTPKNASMQLIRHYSNNTYSIFLYAVLPNSNLLK